MGPIWGRQDPGGPHVDPMNFAIWVYMERAHNVIPPHVADGTYYANRSKTALRPLLSGICQGHIDIVDCLSRNSPNKYNVNMTSS